jgi:hypothetical protein
MNIKKKELLELELLKQVEKSPLINNRMAASKLGCSVKLAHELLSRIAVKGFVSVKKHHSRRWDYFLTPKGIAEKARLTYEYIDFSLQFYRRARKHSSQLCKNIFEIGKKEVTLIGAGELAEICYLGVKEWGLELGEVYDDTDQRYFMGIEIKPFNELISINANAVTVSYIMCLYDKTNPMTKKYLPEEIKEQLTSTQKLSTNFYWVF